MSSNLKVNTILPSAGTAIGIGTAGGIVSLSGSVGIGTSNPNGVLHVENDNANSSTYYLNTDAAVLIQNKNSNASAKTVLKLEGPVGGGDCAIVYGDSSANLIFSDRQNERLRITSEGKVKIIGLSSTTNMQQSLQLLDTDSTDAIGTKSTLGLCGFVNGTGRTLAAVGARKNTAGNNFSGDLSFFTRRNNQSLLDERARITSAGNLEILTGQVSVTTPEYLRVAHTDANHNTSLTDNTTQIIQYASVYDDTKSGWTAGSSNYYTIQTSGYFLVTAQAVIHSDTNNALRDFALGVEQSTDNGSSYSLIQNNGCRAGGTASTDTDTAMPVVTFVLDFTAGTRIRVRAHANTSSGTWRVDEDLGDATGGNDYGGSGFDSQKGTLLYIIRLF